jgi:hypothetical protein
LVSLVIHVHSKFQHKKKKKTIQLCLVP